MKKRDRVSPGGPKRDQRMACYVSEDEMRIIERHLAKYKITNKGRWMRETLLAFIYRTMERDYPTLFNESEMRR